MTRTEFDIIVVGAGLAGLTAALILAGRAPKTANLALVAPPPTGEDGRTTALLTSSVEILQRCGIWEKCRTKSAALSTMRIIDGTKRLLRAPVVNFHAHELNLDAFGFNIANKDLARILASELEKFDNLTIFPQLANHCDVGEDCNSLELQNGDVLHTKLTIAADGRGSGLRDAAGIQVRKWSYPQWALVLNFSHSLPHGNISTEFHTETGPFTQVPLPDSPDGGFRSGLVWVQTNDEAERLTQLPLETLAIQVENRMQSILGKIKIESSPQIFPLSGMKAESMGARRIALVGEAGHVVPPIGAQGFNLGLRDVDAICDLAVVALQRNEDPGSPWILDAYSRSRSRDIASRAIAIDMLNRSLLSSFLPTQVLRTGGLFALSKFSWLRQKAMQGGLAASVKA